MKEPFFTNIASPNTNATSNWFTVEQIDADTFVISEYQHWEETHCYLLLGKERAVLIDTGLGVANIREVVDSLTSLPVHVVTTHVHWDHIGGHRYFQEFAVHEAERSWLSGEFPLSLDMVKYNLSRQPCSFPAGFDLAQYQLFQGSPKLILRDGDHFELGGRTLKVIHTPGHSPGHCCFYEPERRYLYSGDQFTVELWMPSTLLPIQNIFTDLYQRSECWMFCRSFPDTIRWMSPLI